MNTLQKITRPKLLKFILMFLQLHLKISWVFFLWIPLWRGEFQIEGLFFFPSSPQKIDIDFKSNKNKIQIFQEIFTNVHTFRMLADRTFSCVPLSPAFQISEESQQRNFSWIEKSEDFKICKTLQILLVDIEWLAKVCGHWSKFQQVEDKKMEKGRVVWEE